MKLRSRLVLWLAWVFVAPGALADDPSTERTTYSVHYRVRIREDSPSTARVRWELAGIDEIRRLRLRLDRDRFYDFSGTGSLEQRGDELLWRPGSPYAHLDYKVRLRHRRGEDAPYDSYATRRWVITRAKALFPRATVTTAKSVEPHPRSRAIVTFHLPRRWRAYSPMAEVGANAFRPEARGRFLDRPTGWLALGRLDVVAQNLNGTHVTVAKAPGSSLDAEDLLRIYEKTLPALVALLGASGERLLIVSAPDPMWRGGISGERSLYLHGDRPLRTPDRTTPALHELFHVLAPFRPDDDAVWVTEGLAELYSLLLPHRAGLLRDADLRRGLSLFARYGTWNVNLTAQRDNAATNNSAPFVMFAIDRAIRRATSDKRSLDDVVGELARRGGHVSTAAFLRAVNAVSGRNLTPFFQRHVYAGEPPRLEDGKGETPKASDGGGDAPGSSG